MGNKRDRILNLINYMTSCGIKINLGKNYARGNRGFFKAANNVFRIDIAKNLSEDMILTTLAHEFAHFVHYQYDKSLKSLDFIFENYESRDEELISATVEILPKHNISPLFEQKEMLKKEIKELEFSLKKLDIKNKEIESKLKKSSLKYLLNYDKVKVCDFFGVKYYSIDLLENDTPEEFYLRLLSKKRALKRLNSKISKLNKYYNLPTELFARSFELYLTNSAVLKKRAPNIFNSFEKAIKRQEISLLSEFVKKMI